MMEENQIIADIIAGKDRYRELVERYHIGLIIHCERLVNDRQDAEDIAQEAFIRAYQKLSRYDESKSRFSTWLYRIATNLALDHIRKSKRELAVEDIEAIAEVTMPAHIKDEGRAAIIAAVSVLMPPEYKRVIEGYYWHGKSYAELAEQENVPLNTVRTWLRRAKLELRKELV